MEEDEEVISTLYYKKLLLTLNYQICSAYTDMQLARTVSAFIIEGWEPIGGVAVSDRTFYQAMIKRCQN